MKHKLIKRKLTVVLNASRMSKSQCDNKTNKETKLFDISTNLSNTILFSAGKINYMYFKSAIKTAYITFITFR